MHTLKLSPPRPFTLPWFARLLRALMRSGGPARHSSPGAYAALAQDERRHH